MFLYGTDEGRAHRHRPSCEHFPFGTDSVPPLHQPQLHGEFHQPTLAFDAVLFEEGAPVFLYGEAAFAHAARHFGVVGAIGGGHVPKEFAVGGAGHAQPLGAGARGHAHA